MGEFDKDPTLKPGTAEHQGLVDQIKNQRAKAEEAASARREELLRIAAGSPLAPSQETIDKAAKEILDHQNDVSV